MNEECLICKAPLEYLNRDEKMECALCRKVQSSKTRCVKGHFVCDACHSAGMDRVMAVCLNTKSPNPIEILEQMMALPTCHMHGPEHHTMVGAALLTAYKNAGGEIDLPSALPEMQKRGKQVPGGACGFWGACGAGVSAGMFVSIITGSTPLKNREWALSNAMTATALQAIAANGGPRCCKRNSYTAIIQAVNFVEEHLGVAMELAPIKCIHPSQNNQCIGERCPFR